MTKTSNYWDKRAIKRMTDNGKLSENYIKRIKKIYERAYKDIDSEIAKVYKNYSKETALDVQKLKTLLTAKETDKTWKTLQRQGLDKYIQNNYKSRISRLEQIQAQIYAKAKLIYPKEELENTMCYNGVINNSYYKSVYDTQMGTGYDFGFNKIDTNLIDRLLNERWSGKNYSERIWKNTDILAETVSECVAGAMLSGQGIEKTSRQIRDRFNVSKYYAERLVRTETNHFNNEADALAYEEMGVDKYVFVAVLDNRTSDVCQNNDNEVYNFKDREVGVNFPPLHPNCRSTTRGYLGEEGEKLLQRRARNPITGKTELIDNISYKEWAKKNGISIKPTTTPAKPKPVEVKVNIESKIQDVEKSKHGLTHEVGTIMDTKGNILQVIEGGDHEVDAREYENLLKGNIFTHNHPSKATFSKGDIENFVKSDLQELRASNEDKIFSISKGKDVKGDDFVKAFMENEAGMYHKATTELQRKIDNGEVASDIIRTKGFGAILETRSELVDKWLKENASKYGYDYKVISYADKLKNTVKNDIITPNNLINKLDIDLEEYKAFGKYDPFDNNIQEKTSKLLKMDSKPTVLNKKEFEKAEGIDIVRVVHEYHGKTAQEVYNNTLYGDIQYSEHYNSSFGRGIYFGDKSVADSVISTYSKGESKIINAKLSKDAKILEFDSQMEFIKALSTELKNVSKELQQLYQNEKSLLFMLKGIDGIKIKSNGYYCIYNRGVLIINE